MDLLGPLLHLLVGIGGGEAVGLRPLCHCASQVRLLCLRCARLHCIRLPRERDVLLLKARDLKRHPVQHGLNLRRPQQRRRALGQHAYADGRGQGRQLAVSRLIDHQTAGAFDLNAQAPALCCIFRHIQPRLAFAVGHVARFGDEHGAVEIAERDAHRGNGLCRLSVRIRDHNGNGALRRSLLRHGRALGDAKAQRQKGP